MERSVERRKEGFGSVLVVVLAFFDTALIMGLGIDAVLLWVVAAGEWAP